MVEVQGMVYGIEVGETGGVPCLTEELSGVQGQYDDDREDGDNCDDDEELDQSEALPWIHVRKDEGDLPLKKMSRIFLTGGRMRSSIRVKDERLIAEKWGNMPLLYILLCPFRTSSRFCLSKAKQQNRGSSIFYQIIDLEKIGTISAVGLPA